MLNKLLCPVIVVLCLFFASVLTVNAHERNDGGYYNIVDESGSIVYITGWKVRVGDQVLTAENKRYEIISLESDTAHAKFIGQVNLVQYEKAEQHTVLNILTTRRAEAETKGKVAIYHTHSDESYVPTDGTDSIYGNGGIYQVGNAFADSLKQKGIEVIHSDAKHDPHDDMAYERSRRTVTSLIKQQQPNAIFDVHRDSTPPEVYKTTINGEDVTKVQLVVGKYGPTGKQIEDYALQIKAAADKQHPGLIKGIFFAKGGDYNQDLLPRSMLLEVGSHTNDRKSAEKGIALFADVVPTILGETSAGAPAPQSGAAGFGTSAAGPSGATKSIGWILGALVVGAVAFLILSTGSLKEAGAKLKQFTSTEFANFFGPRRKKKRRNNQDGDKD